MAAGTEPSMSMSLHATSASEFLDAAPNMEHTAMVTVELANMPKPCIENTAAMNDPLVFLFANSDIMVEDRG